MTFDLHCTPHGQPTMQIPSEEWIKLSHRERRRLINKERRRWRRKALAVKREEEQAALEEDPEYLEKICEEERCRLEEERKREAWSRLEEEAWLQREREAQEKFRKQREKEEKLQREREERERLIREEWEALQRREREEEEKREKAKREKEERLKEALSVGDRPRVTEQPWHNPLAPDDLPLPPSTSTTTMDYGTEKDTQNCSFFLKTGVCRYGDRCSKKHPRPLTSTTLLIPAMYSSLGLVEQMLNERNQDAGIEYDEGDLYEHFVQFYKDVLPEFSKAGKVVQFKVSCNHQPHLRGNVYVQYSSEEECSKAYQMFNGRWYAQKQLSCEFCPVQKWKSAICGQFSHKRCPKGNQCNFLHVFKNPGDAFSRADRDLPPLSPSSSPPDHSRSRRSFHHLSRRFSGNRRRSRDRSRERSRERGRRYRSRSPRRRRSRSPGFSRSRRRYSRYRSRSKSRSKSRSRSRGKEESKSQKSRRKYKKRDNRSRSRSTSSSRSVSSGRSEHSRDSSLERKSASPSARDSSKAVDSDQSEKHSTSRHSSRKKKKQKHHHHRHQSKSPESLEHKRSKKEKKKHKSKKKHKRHHAHDESRPSKERDEEKLLSHQMEEDKQARDSVVGSELEGGGDNMEDKSHDTVMEGLTGTETVVMEPELNFNTRNVPANDVLVNSVPTVEQQGDHMTPPPPVLVGVASPQPANQSATKGGDVTRKECFLGQSINIAK